MIKKNKEIEITEENIFANDILGRETEIENLSDLIFSTDEALTMSINANWGAGKTTFIKLWKKYLQNKYKINSIYFSAWEDDFSKEPLVSILGEIDNYIKENFKSEENIKYKINEVKKIAGKILIRSLPTMIKVGTKIATAGLLDASEITADVAEQTTKGLIENYSNDKKITAELQEAIKDLLSNIDKDKPFVIFIDELDRCRPLYAIELLERIKHLFGIDGLIFILAIDKKQLSESIKSQYGNIDTASYLKRFIDMEYSIQSPSKDNFCNFLYQEYNIDQIIASKEAKNNYNTDHNHLSMIKYLVESLDLTLREIEQAFIKINIVFKTMDYKELEMLFNIFIFFIILRIKDEEMYFDLILKRKPQKDILDKILLNTDTSNERYRLETLIEAIVKTTSINNTELALLLRKEKDILMNITETTRNIYRNQDLLTDIIEHDYAEWGGKLLFNQMIEIAIRKVEFSDKFNIENDE